MCGGLFLVYEKIDLGFVDYFRVMFLGRIECGDSASSLTLNSINF